ncbi:MAG: metallophosphoesterase, partial [Akkermansiaceae bacterium]
VLISRESDGWSVLESIDGGTLVDPAVADPNFLTTWHTPASYDGPTFLPGQSAPFVSRNQHLRVGQTPLQTIDNFIRPVWLLKEFDGGTTGYRNLTLSGIYNRGFAAYLNGQLVALEGIDAGGSLGSWDLSSPLNDSYDTNFSRQIPGNIIATPGTNTLAIALHPRQFESPGFLTGEFEVRGIPLGLAISQPSLFANTFNNFRLSWQTSQPTSFQLFLGPDPLQLELVAEENDFSTSRDVQMPEFESGGTHYYEVHVADIFGNPLVYTGAFDLYPAIMREPFLQMASPTSMTVKWRTRSPGASIIRYGQDPDNLNQTATGTNTAAPFVILGRPDLSNLVTDHCVTLEGLSPSSKYYYQVGPAEGGQPGSEQQHFTTPPVQGTRAPTRIWVVGDSGAPGPGVRGMRDSYMDYAGDTPADLLLMLGDNAYNSGYDQEYQRAMFDIFPDILRTTPVWPTMGNHDHYSDDYYGIFELPTQGQSGGVPSGTEQYYSFDYGNIHFVCLNSEEDPPGMLEWLRNDLQSTRSDWVIAFFHHGPYTKGSHDSDTESEHFPAREQYLPILESYGVDLVLSGHSHQYERSNFLNGHYGLSSTYRPQDHAIDEGSRSWATRCASPTAPAGCSIMVPHRSRIKRRSPLPMPVTCLPRSVLQVLSVDGRMALPTSPTHTRTPFMWPRSGPLAPWSSMLLVTPLKPSTSMPTGRFAITFRSSNRPKSVQQSPGGRLDSDQAPTLIPPTGTPTLTRINTTTLRSLFWAAIHSLKTNCWKRGSSPKARLANRTRSGSRCSIVCVKAPLRWWSSPKISSPFPPRM